MNTATQSVLNISINLDLIPSVLYLDLPTTEQWVNINLEDIDEKLYPQQLLDGLKGDSDIELQTEELFLVKNNKGVAEALFGACLFRASKENSDLVIKFGKNVFPILLQGKEVLVGDFTGEFQWTPKKTAAGVAYQVCTLELTSDSNPFLYFTIPLGLLKDTQINKPQFNAAMNTEQGIAQFLKVFNEMGFSHCYNLEDLAVGEYAITAIEKLNKTDTTYGLYCYKIYLEGGIAVWAKGKSALQLGQTVEEKGISEENKNFDFLDSKIKAGLPHKLRILDKREYESKGEKRWDVVHSITRGTPSQLSPELPMKAIEQVVTEESALAKKSFDWYALAISLQIPQKRIDEIAKVEVPAIVAEILDTLSPTEKHLLFQQKIEELLSTEKLTVEAGTEEVIEGLNLPY